MAMPAEQKTPSFQDELTAMANIYNALVAFSEEQQGRILKQVKERLEEERGSSRKVRAKEASA